MLVADSYPLREALEISQERLSEPMNDCLPPPFLALLAAGPPSSPIVGVTAPSEVCAERVGRRVRVHGDRRCVLRHLEGAFGPLGHVQHFATKADVHLHHIELLSLVS